MPYVTSGSTPAKNEWFPRICLGIAKNNSKKEKKIMNFMQSLNEELNNATQRTENGAVGYRTTGKKLLDLNFSITSLRNKTDIEIANKFIDAFYEDKMLAMKWLFFCRDREAIGERRTFRVIMKYLAENNQDVIQAVLELVPEYGRWDDLWCLLDTDLKDNIISIVKKQLNEDAKNMMENKNISLLPKWMPSINTSSKETKRLANIICIGLGMTQRQYRKMLSKFRKHLDVVEVHMSAKEWNSIKYEAVPSRANLIYNSAFLRNDEERRREYLAKLEKGETKINASVLFPHDIVHKYMEGNGWRNSLKSTVDTTFEELWKALPDFVKGSGNTICVSDGSGSMTARVGNTNVTALEVANALAIYFAERSSGQFKDKYITFSHNPKLVDFRKAKNLREKIQIALSHNEVANTNIEAVFDLILKTAVNNKMTQEDLPKNILILSDMEFDSCVTTNSYDSWSTRRPNKTLFDSFAQKYAEHGYKLPRLVFWNICSRTGTIPVKENDLGVALVSGFSPAIVKMVLSNSTDPFECLLEQLNDKRYDAVEEKVKMVI